MTRARLQTKSIDLDLIYIYFVCSLALVINIAEILLTWNSNQSIDLDLIYKQNIYRSDLGRLIDCCFTSAVFQLYLWRGQGYKQKQQSINRPRSDLYIFCLYPCPRHKYSWNTADVKQQSINRPRSDLRLIDCCFTSAVFQLYLWRGQGYKQNIYRSDLGRLTDCCFTSAVFQLFVCSLVLVINIAEILLTWNSNQSIDLDLIYVYFVCSLALVINIAEILLTWNSNQSIDLIALSRQQYFSYIYDGDKGTNNIYIDQI
jgi:hypothetical protein